MVARTSQTPTGNLIFDRSYEIISAVGRGRNSVVYKARKLAPRNAREQIVALKVLLGNPKQRGFNHRRMRREALAMLACRNANVVRLNDYVSTKDLCYLSMEYADGGDLRALLETRNSPLPVQQAVDITIQLLRGLEAIHRSGVIHRDIKPENVLLSGESGVKIADFGVAVLPVRDLNDDDIGLGVGTFDYLAPETLKDGTADVRSDLYSVGVTLYQLATNHLPFEGKSISWQINQKMRGLGVSLESVLPDAPLHLAELFKKALANNPAERFQSAAEFRAALEQFLLGTWEPDASVLEENLGGEEQAGTPTSFGEPLEIENNIESILLENPELAESDADYGDDGAIEAEAHFRDDERRRRFFRLGLGLTAAVLLIAGVSFFTGGRGKEPVSDGAAAPAQEESQRAMLSASAAGIITLLSSERTGVVEHLFADGSDVTLVTTPSGENKLKFALGLIGWQPVEVNLASLVHQRKLEIHGSGLKLLFEVDEAKEAEGQVIRGSYKELTSGREGQWRIW